MENKEENKSGEFLFNMMDLSFTKGIKKYKICRNIDFSVAGICACASGAMCNGGFEPVAVGALLVGAGAMSYFGYCNQQKTNMLIDFKNVLEANHDSFVEQVEETVSFPVSSEDSLFKILIKKDH